VAEFIRQNVQGVAEVIKLSSSDQGYHEAFYPTIPGTEYARETSYPTIFGDLGSEKQPGYGGIMTFSVVNITPSAEGVPLYRVGRANSNPSFRCSIYRGFESTCTTSIVDVATNVQICTVPGAVNRCTLTETFTAIVGQGWPICKQDAINPRGCLTSEGKATERGGFVAEYFLSKGFVNPPPPTVLQVIVPACQLVDLMSSELAQCLSRDLPTSEKELKDIPNLVSLFATANATNSEPIAKLPKTTPPPTRKHIVDLEMIRR